MLPITASAVLVLTAAAAFGQTPPCTIRTIAGPTSLYGGDGGLATSAYFKNISGFRFDQSGNLYIADTGNQRIRKVTVDGIVTTIAGTGVAGFRGDGGSATSAELYLPVAVSPDNQGNVYIATSDNRIRKVDASGVISTLAGNGIANYAGDGGPASAAEIQAPADVLADSQGNIFIADTGNGRIREVNSQGQISSVVTGLENPITLAMDSGGNLYVGDTYAGEVLKVDPNGDVSVYAGGGKSSSPVGLPPTSSFFDPVSISIDANGNLALVSDVSGGGLFEVSPSGTVSQIDAPFTLSIGFNQSTLYYLLAETITAVGASGPFAGGSEYGNSGDGGPATSARFSHPGPLALDSGGDVYVVDQYAYQVRKISPDGTITHVAGTPTGESASGDGGPAAQASLGFTDGIAVDAAGNVYITDYDGLVRKIDTGGTISTVIGPGADLILPSQVAVDSLGNIYVQTEEGVYSFTASGKQIGFNSIPYLSESSAWTIDEAGNIYNLLRGVLNKLTPGGVATSLPLPQIPQFAGGLGITADASGDVFLTYIDQPEAELLQEVTSDGRIFTVARQAPALPYIAGAPGQVDMGSVTSLVSDPSGDLYYVDLSTWTVRELTAGCPVTAQPLISANAVVNAGSYDTNSLAPGEITAIFGSNLGPETGQIVPVTSGQFPTQYANVAITVNGYAAPLLYVGQGQVNFVVPFEIAGQRARQVQISYNGVISDSYYANEGQADPGVFAIANPDASVNSASNPVAAGSYVVMYGTGQGVSNPPETDGAIMGDELSTPSLPVTATIDYEAATVLYAGSAPGLVAGVLQVNLQVPATIAAGSHTVVITVGTYKSFQTSYLYTQ